MPRGNPKRKVMLRLDPSMIERVKEASGGNFTRAVEQAIEAWLKRTERKARTDPLAKHLAPPTAREIAARTKDGA
jgi:hypothetical protein